MYKRVNVATLRALPGAFGRVRIALVDHLHDQMTVQAHRWFAVDKLWLRGLSHGTDPPYDFL